MNLDLLAYLALALVVSLASGSSIHDSPLAGKSKQLKGSSSAIDTSSARPDADLEKLTKDKRQEREQLYEVKQSYYYFILLHYFAN